MRGYLAQDAHIVPLTYPVDFTGGKQSPRMSVRNYSHVTLLLAIGVSAAAPGAIQVLAASDNSGTGEVAVPYDLFVGETTNVDTLGARLPQLAAGYTPPATDNIFYVIEVETAQLPQGLEHVSLKLTNGANSVIAASFAILSGARYAGDQSPTVLV